MGDRNEEEQMASILIVDDSSAMRTMIKRILAISGFEMDTCLQACDGEDALSTLRRESVSLVISDINMPRMDGEALLREMSADPALSGIPVVIVSSDATESRASRLLGLGAKGYLVKPFQPQMLRDKLEQVLEGVHA
jgi:two-component system chemotaxis response regulator CheY